MVGYERHHCKCSDGLWRIGFFDGVSYFFDGVRGGFPREFVIKTVAFPKD